MSWLFPFSSSSFSLPLLPPSLFFSPLLFPSSLSYPPPSSPLSLLLSSLLHYPFLQMLADPRSAIVGGTVLPREVRARMTEVLQCSKVDLTVAQSCSVLAASAFPSPVAPLQRITMTTEALVSVLHKYIRMYVCIASVSVWVQALQELVLLLVLI